MKSIFDGLSKLWPSIISGTGIFLVVVLFGEVVNVMFLMNSPPEAFYIGIATSILPILGFIYAGFRLADSEFPPKRYGDLGWWWVGGMVGTVLLIFPINTIIRPVTVKMAVGTIRWSIAIGGSIGLLIGVFQARAVQRAIQAERARSSKRRIEHERDRLDEFVGTIAHDVQNPLHVAKGRVELARNECNSDHLDGVVQAHQQIEYLIENLLLFARKGAVVENIERINLETVVEKCWQAIEATETTLVTELEGEVYADRNRLEQLFKNIFRTGVGYPDMAGTVIVGNLADGFYIAINGLGIPADELEAVLNGKYTTTDSESKLELATVQIIIDAHEWTLNIADDEDGTTRFEITGVEFVDE